MRVVRRDGWQLVEGASLAGFSNHVCGSTERALPTAMLIGGHMRLLVPDFGRRNLRCIARQSGRLLETGRCALPALVTGSIRIVSAPEVRIGLRSGWRWVRLDACTVS